MSTQEEMYFEDWLETEIFILDDKIKKLKAQLEILERVKDEYQKQVLES